MNIYYIKVQLEQHKHFLARLVEYGLSKNKSSQIRLNDLSGFIYIFPEKCSL